MTDTTTEPEPQPVTGLQEAALSLTLQELSDGSRRVGADLLATLQDETAALRMRAVIVLLWLLERRDNPKLTLEDVASRPLSAVNAAITGSAGASDE